MPSRPRSLAALLVVMVALATAQCSSSRGDGGDSAPPKPTTTTAAVPVATQLCEAGTPTQIGELQSPEIDELSGLAASRQYPDVLWGHNDSGDSARIFAIDTTGAVRTTVDLDVDKVKDWEDIAIDGTTIYVADTGDNQRARTEIAVYELAEPALDATSARAEKFTLHYPDGPHDAEALMVDPVGKQLVVVTKEAAGTSHVFATPLATPGVLTEQSTLSLGIGQLVTAGDMSATGATIALRTYTDVWLWDREAGEPLATTLGRPPCRAPSPREQQGEALALLPSGDGYVMSSEGVGSPLWQVLAGTGTPAAP